MIKVAPIMTVLDRTVGILKISIKSHSRKIFRADIKTLTQV